MTARVVSTERKLLIEPLMLGRSKDRCQDNTNHLLPEVKMGLLLSTLLPCKTWSYLNYYVNLKPTMNVRLKPSLAPNQWKKHCSLPMIHRARRRYPVNTMYFYPTFIWVSYLLWITSNYTKYVQTSCWFTSSISYFDSFPGNNSRRLSPARCINASAFMHHKPIWELLPW